MRHFLVFFKHRAVCCTTQFANGWQKGFFFRMCMDVIYSYAEIAHFDCSN